MPAIDFQSARPARLVDTASPEALFEAVDALDDWDDRSAAITDHLLVHWVERAVSRLSDAEGSAELHALVERLLSRHPESSLRRESCDYAQRWAALADVLDAHLLVLQHREPKRLLQRAFVPEVLALLGKHAPDETPQSTIAQRLGLSDSRASQLLALMEVHGLIERRKAGRTRFVRATPVAAQLANWTLAQRGLAPVLASASAASPAKMPRFLEEFARRAA